MELREEKLELERAYAELEKRKQRKKNLQVNIKSLNEKCERKWLCKTGR
jgi:hypothetical protein